MAMLTQSLGVAGGSTRQDKGVSRLLPPQTGYIQLTSCGEPCL